MDDATYLKTLCVWGLAESGEESRKGLEKALEGIAQGIVLYRGAERRLDQSWPEPVC